MPKSINGSVGRGGRNHPLSDVMTVQYLLNCISVSQGGPGKELVVDGVAGPKTIAAIEAFQRKLGGFADGRVDPGGATMRGLQGKANDPYPNQPLAGSGSKSAGNPYAAKDQFGTKDAFGSKAPFGSKDAFGAKAPFGAKDAFGAKAPFGAKDAFGGKGGGTKGF